MYLYTRIHPQALCERGVLRTARNVGGLYTQFSTLHRIAPRYNEMIVEYYFNAVR